MILVSHDRFLIEACADRLWLVTDGTVKTFDGDMDDYRRLVLAGPEREGERAADAAGGQKAEARRAGVEKRAALAPLRKRLEGVEARMAKLTAAIQKIDAALEDGSAFRENAAKAGRSPRCAPTPRVPSRRRKRNGSNCPGRSRRPWPDGPPPPLTRRARS